MLTPYRLVYNKTQRDILWDLEAAFLERPVFNVLMDEVITRTLLDGNTAQDPKKKVRIMVSWCVFYTVGDVVTLIFLRFRCAPTLRTATSRRRRQVYFIHLGVWVHALVRVSQCSQ